MSPLLFLGAMATHSFSKFNLAFLIKIIFSQIIKELIIIQNKRACIKNASIMFGELNRSYINFSFDFLTQTFIIIMRDDEMTQQLLNKSPTDILSLIPRNMNHYQQRSLKFFYKRFNKKLAELQPDKQAQQKRSLACSIVFSPQSKFIIGWQLLNIILMYLYFIQIPIILAFENHQFDNNERLFKYLNTPTIIVFICDIFINMKTSFYKDGLLKDDPQQIRQHYFTTTFIWDIISLSAIFVYEVLQYTDQFQNKQLKIFVVLFYFRFIQLIKVQNTLNRSFDLNRRTKAFLKLILLLLKILLICNAVACSAFYISYNLAKYSEVRFKDGTICTGPCYWVMNVTYADKSLYEYDDSFYIQYVYSLYWASTTMISIGYGDITPKNPKQVTFTIVVQYLSCLLYGYSINQIWSIIQQLNSKKNKIHYRLNIINTYLRDKGIGHKLTSKVNAYLNNYYISKNLRQRQMEAQIIAQLTPSLRKEVFYQSYSALFSQRYFERTKLILIQNACILVKQVGFYEGQMILTERHPCLYYVKKGEIQNYIEQCHRFFKRMYNDDIFGSYQFYTQLGFKSDLKARVYSLLYLISVSDWRNVLKNDDFQFERYYETRQEIMLYSAGSEISYRCYLCNSNFHRSEDCLDNQIRAIIIDSLPWTKNEQNKRKKYRRRQFKTNIHQRHHKKIKRRHSNMIQGSRFRSELSQQSKHNIVNAQQSLRKISTFQDEKRHHISTKFHLKAKNNKPQYLKAIQRIRKTHTLAQIQDFTSVSDYSDDAQFEQLSIDAVADYQFYYSKFNLKQQFRGELSRRRMTRRL